MKTEKTYICEVCGAKYTSPMKAEQCEKSHIPDEKEPEMPIMLSVYEACDLTGQAYTYLLKLCKEKKIKTIMNGRKYLINKRSLVNYFNGDSEEE